MNKYLEPHELERWSFIWSEARLIIAAVTLIMGGVPLLLTLFPGADTFDTVWMALKISWVISGAASLYLLYRWWEKRRLFGKKEGRDTLAFFVMVISGLNLGLAGLINSNIGMGLMNSQFVFVVVGLVYLAAAAYLYDRWRRNGQSLF